MNLLAIETSTDACSVALSIDGEILVDHRVASQQHAGLVLPMIDALMAEAGLSPRQLSAIVYGQGPGSFTGVRVGVAVTQGIALGLDIGVIGISTLASLAAGAVRQRDAEFVAACIDARMDEIYFGAYGRSDSSLTTISSECVIKPTELPVLDTAHSWFWVGTGVSRYRQELTKHYLIDQQNSLDALLPEAQDLIALAIPSIEDGALESAEKAAPVYLRDKVALTIQERALKSVTR